MKKAVLTVTFILASVIWSNAQNFNFEMDKDGEPYVSGVIGYTCGADIAWKRAKNYATRIYVADYNHVEIKEKARTIIITGGAENSKLRYNPFTGAYGDNICYTLELKQGASVFNYTFKDLYLQSQAAGLVNYNRENPLRQTLRDYGILKKTVEDTTIPKKQKKEAMNDYKDIVSSLEKAYEVLMKRVQDIQVAGLE